MNHEAPAADQAQDPRALIVLPPPERAAVALQSSVAENHLRSLIARTSEIKNVVDKHGRDEAHRAAMMLKNARVAIKNTGDEVREDAIKFQKSVIAEVGRLAAIVSDEEDRLFELRDDFDKKVAAEKAEKERIELERKTAILAKIDAIRRLPVDYAGLDSTALTEALGTLAKREIMDDEFAEFVAEARMAVDTTASALMVLRERALEREEQARREAEARRLEAERLEAERAALAAQKLEQDRIAAEQAAAARALAEQQAALLAQQQAEAQRQQDEADAERRKLEQAAADLAEQRAAFAREQEEVRRAAQPAPEQKAPPANSAVLIAKYTETPVGTKLEFVQPEEDPQEAQAAPRAMPSETEIVDVLVAHYGEARETVIEWLLDMDELMLKMAV